MNVIIEIIINMTIFIVKRSGRAASGSRHGLIVDRGGLFTSPRPKSGVPDFGKE
jgi:hypothetical protein